MFTPSEWALIRAGKWLPELSHFVPVTSPRNLDDNLNHARDEGEKIDLLIHTALNSHAPALIGLGEFLNSRDLTILAATLRGFASIGEALRPPNRQNHPPDYLHHLEHLQYVLRDNLDLHDDENPSVHLFKRLCHDAESGGSEMVRWAAAHALQDLDYPLNLRRQLLSRPPAEILAEIWTKYELRLSESNRQRDPSKMLEDVKFGIYGDTKKLFAKCDAGYSLEIARQVLQKSGVRGIKLAIESRNKPIVQAAINFAGELFNNNRYKDNTTRQKLADLLLPLLNQTDFDLRNLAAEKLNDKKNQYDVSNRFIDQNNRAKVAVIDIDWKRATDLGELAIPTLVDVVEERLKIFRAKISIVDTIIDWDLADFLDDLEIPTLFPQDKKQNNLACQINAIKSIDNMTINIAVKLTNLSRFLLGNLHICNSTSDVLQPQKNLLEIHAPNAGNLLKVFTYLKDYTLINLDDLEKISISQIDKKIADCNNDLAVICSQANSGKQATKLLATQLNLQSSQTDNYIDTLSDRLVQDINKLLPQLKSTKQNLQNLQESISNKQNILKNIYDSILNLDQDINNKLTNIPDHSCLLDQNYQTIEECNTLISQLNNLHLKIFTFLNDYALINFDNLKKISISETDKKIIAWNNVLAVISSPTTSSKQTAKLLTTQLNLQSSQTDQTDSYIDTIDTLSNRLVQDINKLLLQLKSAKQNCNRPIAYRKIKGLGFCTGVC